MVVFISNEFKITIWQTITYPHSGQQQGSAVAQSDCLATGRLLVESPGNVAMWQCVEVSLTPDNQVTIYNTENNSYVGFEYVKQISVPIPA